MIFSCSVSTFFRSLDKGFHTDNAITHVFEKAKPVRVPDVAKDCYVTASGETYTCPRYIYNKLNVLRYTRIQDLYFEFSAHIGAYIEVYNM